MSADNAAPESVTRFIARWSQSSAAEEATEKIRWLHPDYQNPHGAAKLPWSATLPNRVSALRARFPLRQTHSKTPQ